MIGGSRTGSKITPQNQNDGSEQSRWISCPKFAIALYPYKADGKFEISLEVGEKLKIEEEIKDWYKGSSLTFPNKKGIFPANHVKYGDSLDSLQRTHDVAIIMAQFIAHEWVKELKQLAETDFEKFSKFRPFFMELVELRHELISTTSETLRETLKQKIKVQIENGLRILRESNQVSGGQLPSSPLHIKYNPNEGYIYFYEQHLNHDKQKEVPNVSAKLRASMSPTPLSIVKKIPSSPMMLRASGKNRNTNILPDPKVNLETSSGLFQISLDLKAFMCSTGEPSEVYFSLYDSKLKKFTEEYQIVLTPQGMPEDVNRIGKLKAVFIDLSESELQAGMYLVCRLIRRGKISESKDKKSTKKLTEYRRLYGCAILDLTNLDNIFHAPGVEKEHTLVVKGASSEAQLALLPEMIVKNSTGLINLPHAKGIVLGLALHQGSFEETLITTPELYEYQRVIKLGFPELIMPGFERHDFYLTIEAAEFAKAESIEITGYVKLDDGEKVQNCFVIGSGAKPLSEYRSLVFSKENSPVYRETVHLVIPPQLYEKAHLYFVFSVGSDSSSKDKEKGFAFLPLTKDKAVIADGEHVLTIYKPSDVDFSIYLKDTSKLKERKIDKLKISTLLSSTKLTTNPSMKALLDWQTVSPTDLSNVLNRFTYIPIVEVLKFFNESFNAMFQILDRASDEIRMLVFDALVFIIGILIEDKRSKSGINFRPVLDSYISKFSDIHISSHKHLLTCLKKNFTFEGNQQISKLIASFKALEYIFKFIIASRLVYNKKQVTQPENEDVSFKNDLLEVFSFFNQLMGKTTEVYRGPQTNALKNIGSVITDFTKIFAANKLSLLLKDFLDSVKYDPNLKILNIEKLTFCHKLVFSELFLNEEARTNLYPSIINQVIFHLKSSNLDEKGQSVIILNSIIHLIETRLKSTNLLESLSLLLPSIIKVAPTMKAQSYVDILTSILVLFELMTPKHYEQLLQSLKKQNEDWNFILKLLQNFQAFTLSQTYNKAWLHMILFQFSTTLKIWTYFIKYILTEFNNAPNKDEFLDKSYGTASKPQDESEARTKQDIWKQFFRYCKMYIQKVEATKYLNPQKCDFLRIEMFKLLKNMWNPLSNERKLRLIPILAGAFIEFQTISITELQQASVELYFQYLEAEFQSNRGVKFPFPKIESITIETLDKISSGEKIEVASKDLKRFIRDITNLLQKSSDGEFKEKGLKFVHDINYFLDLQMELYTLPAGPEYEDDRTVANMKLMEYLKQTNRKEAYIRHIHILVDQHIQAGNYTEGAEALLLHARLYKWSQEKLGEIAGKFPAQTQRARKEMLYQQAIDYFDKGKMWERACSLIKELREQYQFHTYAYENLVTLLEFQAMLTEKIVKEQRFFAEYYRVAYYGKGFDQSIQGKEFIYRGLELEMRQSFVERIQTLFPKAEVLTYTNDPPAEIVNGNGQYLQIISVKPASREEMKNAPSKIPENMPTNLRKYYEMNDQNIFVYSKPFRKSEEKSDNEFKDLWIRNSYYITEDSFPTIHRRSEIKKKVVTEVSPIENAVSSIKQKNRELQEMSLKYDHENEKLAPFTMVLKGVIDAAVNGGPQKYKDAFFNPTFEKLNSDKVHLVKSLKSELMKQLELLEFGMSVHKRKCDAQTLPLHEEMEVKFVQMKQDSKY